MPFPPASSPALPVYMTGEDGEPVAVSTAAIGEPTDAAWNGTDPSASVISLLKAIALNTTPA